MKYVNKITLQFIFCLCLFAYPIQAHAQQTKTAHDSLKIGLVLSGGGARGFAHIGALKVLEELNIRPDIITGTSMGSVIGALYSIGYSAAELDSIARSTNWISVFSDTRNHKQIPPQNQMWEGRFAITLPASPEKGIELPTGFVYGQEVGLLFNELYWPALFFDSFSDLPIPFSCVAMDLESGEPVRLDHGYLPDAIRSSIAIPTIFTPNEVDGKLLVDGGWVRNLPVQDALDMGADIIIAVDVTTDLFDREKLSDIFKILDQTNKFRITEQNIKQRALADIIIDPQTDDFQGAEFNLADTLISLGEIAAKKQFQALEKYRGHNSHINRNEVDLRKSSKKTLRLKALHFTDEDDPVVNTIKKRLSLVPGEEYSIEQINNAISRVYSTALFDQVKPKIQYDKKDESFDLYIFYTLKSSNDLRIGFRYDNTTRASLLFQGTFRNVFSPNSILRSNIRLGQNQWFQINHTQLNSSRWFGVSFNMEYRERQFDFYRDQERISNYRLDTYTAGLYIGSILFNKVLISTGARYDFSEMINEINLDELPFLRSDHLLSVHSFLLYDQLDRPWFPRRGQKIFIDLHSSGNLLDYDDEFFTAKLWYRNRVYLNEKVSLGADVFLGRSVAGRVPPMFSFFAPSEQSFPVFDYISLPGFRRHELSGNNMAIISGIGQLHPTNATMVQFTYGAGNTLEEFDRILIDQKLIPFFGVKYGQNTIIGPIEVSANISTKDRSTIGISIGYEF